jgi:hypothetical protein
MRELDIRLALLSSIQSTHSNEAETLILEELGLCQGVARVDLAVVNGKVHGFEIKSAQDTLTRLPTQSEVYNRALDLVTIVVDRKHLKSVKSLVPKWWGICEARQTRNGSIELREIRSPSDKPQVDLFAQAQLLWRAEALEVLVERQLDSGLRTKPRHVIWRRLADSLPPAELKEIVRTRLKHRLGWRVESRSG